MMSRTERAAKRAAIVSLLLAVLLLWGLFGSGALAVEGKNERTLESIMEAYDSLVKQGMEGAATLLKSTKREKAETVAVWDDLNERFISVFSKIGHFEFNSLLKKEKNESKANRAAEWANSMTLFIHDLQAIGEVVAWQQQANREIFQMEFDIEKAPNRLAGYTDSLKERGPRLEAIAGDLKTGKLSSSEIQECLEELQSARIVAENISSSILREIEYLKEELKLKKEMDKRIEKILENWKNMKARHPNVAGELSDAPIAWVPLAMKHWQNLEKSREDFEKAYAPFLEGKIMKDIPVFRDYKNEDLAKPVIALQVDLKTMLVSAVQKEKSIEELRKELAKDEELSREEHERVKALVAKFSADKLRVLQLARARAAGGAARLIELRLIQAREPIDSEKYKKAVEDLALIDANRHPEQLAAVRAVEEFEAGSKKSNEEIGKIIEEYKRRKKSLGLAPDF